MSADTTTERPSLFSRLRQVIARHPVAAFLIMVYGVNVGVAFLPFLTRRDLLPFGLAAYDSVGHIVGSALPALLVVAAVRGRAGVRDLASRSLRWRVGLRWYLLALLGAPIASVLAATALLGPAPLDALAGKWPLLFPMVLPQLLLLILFFNLAEEIGWTGFLFARLQDRYRPLTASAIQSVFLVGLFHSAFNATTANFVREFIPATAEDQFLILNGVVIIAAILIIILTRGRLSYRPGRGL